ncbi:hypothetical protein Barb4_04969 [Bacteroidales bacterium Barb4]|nr:hypothetical protein Barb4_04969 [Bacteroidales bacterium Barb4]
MSVGNGSILAELAENAKLCFGRIGAEGRPDVPLMQNQRLSRNVWRGRMKGKGVTLTEMTVRGSYAVAATHVHAIWQQVV